jgi:hypothetical protein
MRFVSFILGLLLCVVSPFANAQTPILTENWVGTNYTPAYAVNQIHFWRNFRAEVVEKELAAAHKYFGMTTLRVYLHPINFEQDRENFFANLEKFLTICNKHHIKPGFTFFDDCHRIEGIFLDHPAEPVKGFHNGRWAAAPQFRDRDINNIDRYKPYLQDIVSKYKDDDRVLWWETYNEPKHWDSKYSEYSLALRKAAYQYVKAVNPKQPVISCWDDSPETDIVNAHNYVDDFSTWDRQADLNPAKGCVFTEAGARWYAPEQNYGEPVDVIHWLETRKREGKYVPGVYLCWELMVGNSNCRWINRGIVQNEHYIRTGITKVPSAEPTLPWCGLLWPDATPVSLAEAEAIRRYVTGETKALFFDDFQKPSTLKTAEPTQKGNWTIFSPTEKMDSGVCEVGSMEKMIAGDEKWKDIVLESVVMLTGEHGNAGLIFRVNNPGMGRGVPSADDFTGYYVGFNTKTLQLGKMTEGVWKLLEEYPLERLDCKVVPGVWNTVRIAVSGPRIRVWFNRMHPSSDVQNGLRFDYTDTDSPILNGKIGLRSYDTIAKFDNVIVLPIEELPSPE